MTQTTEVEGSSSNPRPRGSRRRPRWCTNFGVALVAALTLTAWAQESQDRPAPTFEETVQYIGEKLSSCPKPQSIRFAPPSTITLAMPLFALRQSAKRLSEDGETKYVADFPKIPGAMLEVSFDLAELNPHVETGDTVYSRTFYHYSKPPSSRYEIEMYKATFGGGTRGGLGGIDVYQIVLACGRVSPCFHSRGAAIPAPWRDAHRVGDHSNAASHDRHPSPVDRWEISSLAYMVTGEVATVLLVCDADAAERVGRAMTYLIGESGGEAKSASELF